MNPNTNNFKNEIRFAAHALRTNLANNTELRGSFLMHIFAMMINNVAFIILWVYFVYAVGEVNGWRAIDIVGLLGFGTISFGLTFSFGGGLRKLAEQVTFGMFDKYMLAPKNLIARVATSSFGISALGDLVFGIICMVFFAIVTALSATQIALLLFACMISTVVWFSAAVAMQSASFYFTDGRNVVEGLFDLFLTPTIFHGGAFHGILRFIFLIVIPALLVGAIPVEIVRDVSFLKLIFSAVVACIWLVLSLVLFRFGVRRYESTNFLAFGD